MNMRRLPLLIGLVLAQPALAVEPFTVVALPDTQNYSEAFPAIFSAQTQWVADNVESLNIRFLTHLGDLVQHGPNTGEWQNADAAMAILDAAGIPYGAIPGNHDILYDNVNNDPSYYDRDGIVYRAYFGPQRFAGKAWYRGHSPSELSNYQIIDLGDGFEVLFLHLNLETPASELGWAQGVLNANRDKPVMVSTHRYLQDAEDYTGGLPLVPSGRFPEIWYLFEPLYRHDGVRSEVFFNSFVRANRNIFLVNCGHFHEQYDQVSVNNWGLPVYEVLTDYQDDPNGGDGWLRQYRFRPDDKLIEAVTYSPTLDRYRTDRESDFAMTVGFGDYVAAPGSSMLVFQRGISGYDGTRDTYVSEAAKDTSYGTSSVVVVDNDVNNNIFNDRQAQGLLRFDDIVDPHPVYEGDPLPTRIPQSAVVSSASLSFHIIDDVDIGGEDLLLYRCTRSWDETSTWNSLGGGIQTGSETGPLLAVVDGDNVPAGNTARSIVVTDTVTDWLSGAPNLGFALLPENTAFNDDGMEFASSENASIALRPALSVELSYPVLNRAPTVVPLSASRTRVNEGDSVVLSLSATDPNPADPVTLRIDDTDVAFGIGSASVNRVVVFEDEGVQTFVGEVLDDEDSISAGAVTITIDNADPIITQLPGDMTVELDALVGLSATATDPGVLDILVYDWDLDGDGSYDDGAGSTIAHAFGQTGTVQVGLRVTDGDGGEATGSFAVNVIDDEDSDGLLDAWEIEQFGTVDQYTGSDDPDGDCWDNEAEETARSLPLQERSFPMPEARLNAAAARLGERIFVAGGTDGTEVSPALWEYRPECNQYSTLAPMPLAREGHALVGLGDHLYALGGETGSGETALVHRYDPATDGWTRVADMLQARAELAGSAVGDNLYVFGGRNPAGPMVSAERYDPALDAWSPIADLPAASAELAAARAGQRVLLIGAGASGRDLLAYDPDSDSYAIEAVAPARPHPSAVALGRDQIVAAGGIGPSGRIDIYQLAAKAWRAADAGLVEARDALAFAQLDCTLYGFGGAGNSGPLRTAERLKLAAPRLYLAQYATGQGGYGRANAGVAPTAWVQLLGAGAPALRSLDDPRALLQDGTGGAVSLLDIDSGTSRVVLQAATGREARGLDGTKLLLQDLPNGRVALYDWVDETEETVFEALDGWQAQALHDGLILFQHVEGGEVLTWDIDRDAVDELIGDAPGWLARDLAGSAVLLQQGGAGGAVILYDRETGQVDDLLSPVPGLGVYSIDEECSP